MFQSILDIIYPVRCPVCGEIVVPKCNLICSNCKEKLAYVTEPRCKKCSKPIEQEEKEYCDDCMKRDLHFIKGYAVWVYDEMIKYSIAEFKYHSKKEYARFYINEILRVYGKELKKLSLDAIVPIPIHKLKYLERGYNQADILAQGIGKELDLPVLSKLLLRNKKTLPQKQLNDKERLRNLRQAFEFNETVATDFNKKINRILLVDDIYTTGSTIEACTSVLMKHQIHEIYFITLCIGKGF